MKAFWRPGKAARKPEQLISKDEAIARAREYAQANGMPFDEPFDIYVESKRGQGDAAAKPEKRPVYIIRCGAYIPMPVVEVDATDGTVLKWQTFPR